MTGPLAMSRIKLRRQTLVLFAGTVAALLAYGMFLFAHEQRAAATLDELRRTDMSGYLEQIRKLEGFEAYLALFTAHRNFDQPRALAPAFMIGRWTLREERERISALTRPECRDPITFEYGHLEIPLDNIRVRATYRIEGQNLFVAPATMKPFTVRLVSFGSRIDHLQLQPPGRDRTYYAYPCEM